MEIQKNSDIIRTIFKVKDTEKKIIPVLHQLKRLKCTKSTTSIQGSCLTLYQEASSYFFQGSGFLKSLYFEDSIRTSSKNFLLNNLFVPAYKKFIELRQNLALLDVENLYVAGLNNLKDTIEEVNSSISEILNELSLI